MLTSQAYPWYDDGIDRLRDIISVRAGETCGRRVDGNGQSELVEVIAGLGATDWRHRSRRSGHFLMPAPRGSPPVSPIFRSIGRTPHSYRA